MFFKIFAVIGSLSNSSPAKTVHSYSFSSMFSSVELASTGSESPVMVNIRMLENKIPRLSLDMPTSKFVRISQYLSIDPVFL